MQTYKYAEHVRPQNSLQATDPALWFLREIQAVVSIACKKSDRLRGPELSAISLRQPDTSAALALHELIPLPGFENHFIAIENDGLRMHLLAGPRMESVLVGSAHPRRLLRCAASRTGLFLLDDLGQVHRIPVLTLTAERRTTGSAVTQLSFTALGAQLVWSPPEGSNTPPHDFRLACPLHKKERAGDSVIVFSPGLDEVVLVTVVSTAVSRKPLELKLSSAFRTGLELTGGLPGEDDSVALVDVRGARMFGLDPFRNKPTLQAMAGDGYAAPASSTPYGLLPAARLHAITSACRFSLSQTEIRELGDLVAISPDRKVAAGFARGLTSSEERFRRCTELMENLDFYVLFDEASKVVSSISCAAGQGMLARLGVKLPAMFLPLSPPLPPAGAAIARAGHPLNPLRQGLRASSRVCSGPGSTLLFWSPGSADGVLLNSVTSQLRALCRDDEFMNDLASRTKLKAVFEDSSRY